MNQDGDKWVVLDLTRIHEIFCVMNFSKVNISISTTYRLFNRKIRFQCNLRYKGRTWLT